MHAHFQSSRARIFNCGGAELLGQGEDAEDAANPRFSELVINKVAECADVSTGSSGSPQKMGKLKRHLLGVGFFFFVMRYQPRFCRTCSRSRSPFLGSRMRT